MCVCFNHSNLVPAAEPSGDRKQKEDGGARAAEGGEGRKKREMGEGDKMEGELGTSKGRERERESYDCSVRLGRL